MRILDIPDYRSIADPTGHARQQLCRFVEQAPLSVAMFDRDMKYLAYSGRWLADLGRGFESLLGVSHYEVYPDNKDEQTVLHFRALAGETVRSDEDFWQTADGAQMCLRWVAFPWHDDAGKVGGILIFAEHVTERDRLLEKITQSEQRMELALDGANLGMWDLDLATGRFTHGPRLIAMLGYAPGEIAVNEKTFVANLHPEDAQTFAIAFYEHLKGKTPRLAVEYRMRHKHGHWVWIISRGKVVERNEKGRAIRMAGTNLDITDRKLAQETERRLTRAFKLISKCASVLVHADEENALLAAICRLSVELGGYLMAWVGYAEHDADRTVRALAHCGDTHNYLESAGITWADTARGRGPVGTAIRKKRPIVVQDMNADANMTPWRDAARANGYRSCIALPLIVEDQVLGALAIYSLEPGAFGKDEVRLLKQLADDLSFGIQTLRSRAAHERASQTLRRESEKNRALLRNASDGIHILDASGSLVEASDSFCAMLGYRRDEIIGRNVSEWDLGCADIDDSGNLRQRLFDRGRSQIESVHRRKDGTTFDVEISGQAIEMDGGTLLFYSSRDITERKRAQNSLRESEMRFRAIIDQSPIGMAFGRDGVTLDVNAVYLQMFGYETVADLKGKSLLEQIAPQCRGEMEDRIRRRAQGEPVESSYETVGLRRDGSQFPMHVSAKRLQLQDGPLTFAFLIDVTQQKVSEKEIQRLAFYDHLTNLPNRRLLQDRLQQALAASERSKEHGALLFIDLDDFKSLNDTMGHATGDALLQQVASRLKANVRQADSVARLGGDEFVVLLQGLSEREFEAAQQTEATASKIFSVLTQPYWLSSHLYQCTTSIGATLFVGHQQEKDELIKQADIAMYEAKRGGRNSLRFFNPQMQEAVNTQVSLQSELRRAVASRQFCLHYQVQVDGANRPLGAEALIRWNHPARGLVSPAHFIAVAEETNLILPIGQWVLETACEQLKAWEKGERSRHLAMSVNVSAKQFHDRNFVESVRSTVRSHGVNPALLTLELTETLLLENVEETIATMGALRETGVRFSLDDFGTGYSSLQYLRRLPLHQLKVDQSFVRDIASDGGALAIVQTILAMAGNLGLAAIAEGVETQEQRQLLLEKGCREFQGYLFGRPMPIDEFDKAFESM